MKKILGFIMWVLILGGLGAATATLFLGVSVGGFASNIALGTMSVLSLIMAITLHARGGTIKRLKKQANPNSTAVGKAVKKGSKPAKKSEDKTPNEVLNQSALINKEVEALLKET